MRSVIGSPQQKESMRQNAIRGIAKRDGYSFIRLVWADPSRREVHRVDDQNNQIFALISGVEIYEGTAFEDPSTHMPNYHCFKSQGQAKFVWSYEYGTAISDILDTDYNRNFLATHLSVGKWEVETTKEIFADLEERAETLKEQAVQVHNDNVSKAEARRYQVESKESRGKGEDEKEVSRRVNDKCPPVRQKMKLFGKKAPEKTEKRGRINIVPPELSPNGMVKP